ncbi:glutamate synthase [Desulfobotulus mexicanus]|uniref:Glutamate synthase n=1 Tax=Desulfobotulus mexicanus TaxID=2586642 RepID=A0A5Q4VCG0_9BACT|nr:glutamate synthase [Desulfobotulus mexicanus]TYT75235.1 glutamate synthase [Desulfobotulus mexicanus]
MCRLFAVTSDTPLSPMKALEALDAMREGHDGSGVGLFMRDLGGPFAAIKGAPILSGIFTDAGLKKLDTLMMDIGFMTKYRMGIQLPETPPAGTPSRDIYLIRAYDYPRAWENLAEEEKHRRLLKVRLELREMGEADGDMIVFSFWPDVIMIKEIGDPLTVGRYMDLDRHGITARIIMAQGRQNTNYAINLYACHPFFLEGFATMTNGENTAFIPVKEFLESRGFDGYIGFQSDSEVFVHILHYISTFLDLPLDAYKHIITPLPDEALNSHPDASVLRILKQSCRRLIIDGPNCIIGNLPDGTLFMGQDSKKLRPGIVGGKPGIWAFSSEVCGLDTVIPDRDKSKDFQPMHLDMAMVGPDRKEVKVCRQTDRLSRQA